MVALFFNFSKRINSTKTPNDTDGTEEHISIRGNIPSGQLSSQSGTEYFDSHPTIWVSGNNHYNYVKLGGRYYFVRDRQREINDATVYYLEEDYLATFKTEILNTVAKVIYSSSDYNLDIDDIRNQEKENTTVAYHVANLPFNLDTQNGGTFLLTVAGGKLISSTYAMYPTELENFMTVFYNAMDIQFSGVVKQNNMSMRNVALDASIDIAEAFINWAKDTGNSFMEQLQGAFDSIKDVKWSPFERAVHAKEQSEVFMGTYDTGQACALAYGILQPSTITIQIPHQGSNYQKGKRFSSYGLYIPFCGQYMLNNDDIYGISELHIILGIDRQTGDIAGTVNTPSGKKILSVSGSAARSVIYGLSDKSTLLSLVKGIGTGIIDIATGAVSGGPAGAATNAARSVARMINGVDQTQVITGGTLSSCVGLASGMQIMCFSTMKGMADSQTAIKDVEGLPCHKTVQLSTLTGYCLCDHASVPMEGTFTEKQYVNSALNSGFYIE